MKTLKFLFFNSLFVFALAGTTHASADEASQFVTDLKDKALALFTQFPDINERRTEICKLVDQNVDLEKMSNASLSLHKAKFSAEQLAEFNQALRGMLANIFDLAFQRLQNGEVVVDQVSKPFDDGRTVNVTVQGKDNRSSTRLMFFLSMPKEDQYLLYDASLNSMRILLAKRSEFNDLITEAEDSVPGSGADALIRDLKENNAPCP